VFPRLDAATIVTCGAGKGRWWFSVWRPAKVGAARTLWGWSGVPDDKYRREVGGEMPDEKNTVVIGSAEQFWHVKTRRDFLRVLGIGGTVVLLPSVFGACDDDDEPVVAAFQDVLDRVARATDQLGRAVGERQLLE